MELSRLHESIEWANQTLAKHREERVGAIMSFCGSET